MCFQGTVYSECSNEGVIGTQQQIKMVEDYVDSLEKERLNHRKKQKLILTNFKIVKKLWKNILKRK